MLPLPGRPAASCPPSVFFTAAPRAGSPAPAILSEGQDRLRFWGDVRARLATIPALRMLPSLGGAVPLAFGPADALDSARDDRGVSEQRETVVLVEDDPSTLILLRDVLLSAGFQVLAFASPFEALASLKRSIPGLLVLDWHLPEMNGRALIEHLHAYLGQLPPVLVLTGDVRLKVASHVTEVIRKPLSLERLVERVHSLMSVS